MLQQLVLSNPNHYTLTLTLTLTRSIAAEWVGGARGRRRHALLLQHYERRDRVGAAGQQQPQLQPRTAQASSAQARLCRRRSRAAAVCAAGARGWRTATAAGACGWGAAATSGARGWTSTAPWRRSSHGPRRAAGGPDLRERSGEARLSEVATCEKGVVVHSTAP